MSSRICTTHRLRRSGSKPSKSRPVQAGGIQVRLLAVTGDQEARKALSRILKSLHWQVLAATSYAEADAILASQRIPIVVCDHELPDGNWRSLLQRSSHYREQPTLIVTSRLADDHLWAEVLNLGGYDVLSQPFDEHEVRRVITGAWVRRASPMRVQTAAHS